MINFIVVEYIGLDKSELIGDAGSRSFYLRRSGSNCSSNAEIIPATMGSPPPPPFLLPTFIARKFGKIVRRAHKLWKVVICMRWWLMAIQTPPLFFDSLIVGVTELFFRSCYCYNKKPYFSPIVCKACPSYVSCKFLVLLYNYQSETLMNTFIYHPFTW